MDIEWMREYVVLAQCLNFTEAANRLYITQPTLSKHISLIEAEAQVRLLNRTKHSVTLTKEGELFTETCRRIIQEFDDSILKMGLLASGISGSVKLGILYYGINRYVTPALTQMGALYPNVKVFSASYQPLPLWRDFMNNLVDIAEVYRTSSRDNPYVSYRDVGWLRFSAMVKKDSPMGKKTEIPLKALDGLPLILNSQTPKLRDYILDKFVQKGVHPGEIIYSDHIDTINADFSLHDALALVTDNSRYIAAPDSSFVSISDPDFRIMMAYAYRKNNPNKAISYFLKALDAAFPAIDEGWSN